MAIILFIGFVIYIIAEGVCSLKIVLNKNFMKLDMCHWLGKIFDPQNFIAIASFLCDDDDDGDDGGNENGSDGGGGDGDDDGGDNNSGCSLQSA